MKYPNFTLSISGMAFLLLLGCGKTDMSQMHQLNTHRPRLTETSRQFSTLQGHLEITEERYRKDWSEVSQFLDLVPDSLRDATFHEEVNSYKKMMPGRDSIHAAFNRLNAAFQQHVTEFGQWEEKVRAGGTDRSEVDSRMADYEKKAREFQQKCDSLNLVHDHTLELHNEVLKDLNERAGRFENHTITWK